MTHPNRKILLVEDNEDFAFGLSLILRKHGFFSSLSSTLQDAKEQLSREAFDIILLDLTLPDASGVEVVSAVRELQRDAALLVLTGHDNAELAVHTLRLGAQDYLTKPISEKDLLKSIELNYKQVHSRNHARAYIEHASTYVIGDAPAWQNTLSMLKAAAASPKTTVLLTGEPGVGKEVAAQLLHKQSHRSRKPMLAINMACLPSSLLEAELFGYEEGAFTGARGTKKGVFEQANGGTLFLDEICDVPLDLQAKMLRVLEGKPFRRLGGDTDVQPDVRLISATNRSLPELVEKGLFRQDLYHRLKVLEIQLPPLRERAGDIEKLALHFLVQLGAEMGYKDTVFSNDALHILRTYSWPGNVRELRNVVERALVLSRGQHILPMHLPQELKSLSQPAASYQETPHKEDTPAARENTPRFVVTLTGGR